ncbi:MAG TPA: hypothetical protein VFP84_27240 [Kofleriaceae bacterium]|nr:hypothetical protein [Kofleriaceae bacterium]
MLTLEARERHQIEAALGRALTADEHAPVAVLTELSPAALAVARQLVAAHLPLCLRYLLAVARGASVRDVLLFTHNW